jgi:hypothetical protein
MIIDRLGATPLVLQIPVGAEADFKGVVDLIAMKALLWSAEAAKGEMYDTVDIPATHTEAAQEWHDKLLETLAETLHVWFVHNDNCDSICTLVEVWRDEEVGGRETVNGGCYLRAIDKDSVVRTHILGMEIGVVVVPRRRHLNLLLIDCAHTAITLELKRGLKVDIFVVILAHITL